MEELQMLRDLPAVANVSKDRITYSNAFKQVCVIRYLAGESPTKIFREAGLPPELIGYKRIERSVARWKAAVLKSVNGSSNMSNGEIITELVNLYVHAVTRKEKLDDIAGIANLDKANIENAPNSLDGANVSGGGISAGSAYQRAGTRKRIAPWQAENLGKLTPPVAKRFFGKDANLPHIAHFAVRTTAEIVRLTR